MSENIIPRAVLLSVINGGTSRALFFRDTNLPADPILRDALLLDLTGEPEMNRPRGLGGGDGLTSKIAIVKPSTHPDADVDYEFAQVVMGESKLDRTPTCGNILVGVGPYAIEQGFVKAKGEVTEVKVHQVNTKAVTSLTVQTPGGRVIYDGDQKIEGVSGSAAPISVNFDVPALAKLMPTGNAVDTVVGIQTTLVNWGMQTAVARADAFGLTGYEDPAALENNPAFMARVNEFRIAAGALMGLGDVTKGVVPKIALLAAPREEGSLISTRCMINPKGFHKGLGVMAAASIGWACLLPGSPVHDLAVIPPGDAKMMIFEHPTGRRFLRTEIGGTEAEPVLMGGGDINAAWKITDEFPVYVNTPRVREFMKKLAAG